MWYKTNLHRIGKKADWELTPPSKRNTWQRLAASTKGIVAPANATSVVGLTLVGIGLWCLYVDEITWGFILIACGRLADILDGIVAQATGTKSSVGEAVDATLDKIAVIGALIIFVATETIPLFVVIIMTLRNVANIAVGLIARARKKLLHPSRAGKFAGGMEWLAILFFLMAILFKYQDWVGATAASNVGAYVALGLTLILGVVAIGDYGRRAMQGKSR